MFTNPAMNVTVTGGSLEENTQLCSLIQQALCNTGMTNVSIDEGSMISDLDGQNVISCLQRLNPDLFDTPVIISGECDADIQSQAIGLGLYSGFTGNGFAQMPAIWGQH